MKLALFAVVVLFPVFLRADVIKVVSPDTAQTFSCSDVTWHTLHWDEARQRLSANITFSTFKYAGQYDPKLEESYRFEFPGVKFDSATSTFYVRGAKGERVPVASLTKDLIGKSIKPLPAATIYIVKQSGKVVVALTADTHPHRGTPLHWIEDNEGWFLDNAVRNGIASLDR